MHASVTHFLLGLSLVLTWGIPRAFALNPIEAPADYIIHRWDIEDGLPHNSIRNIFQTRDGYLWVGTMQGLARFDGLTFTVFNRHNTPGFPGNQITSMAETSDGSLWIGTSEGLGRYHEGKFTTYRTADGLKVNTVNAVCVAPDGSLWIGSGEGITRWADERFINDISTQPYNVTALRSISVDRQKAIWIAAGMQALRYADGQFTHFGHAEGLAAEVQMIREDAEGEILAVTQNGVRCLEQDRFMPYGVARTIASQRVGTTLVDRDSNLWVGTTGGLDRIADDELLPYLDRHGERLGVVDALFEDREGSLWIGTSAGLYRLNDRRGSTLTSPPNSEGKLALAVLQTRDGSIWTSTWGEGVERLSHGNVTHYKAGAPLAHETITALYEEPDGTMWLGTRGSSLNRLRDGKVSTFVYQAGVATSRPVTALYSDPEAGFLVGISRRGLLQMVDEQLVPVPEAKDFVQDTVWTIHRLRDGRLIVGTSKGLYERDPDRSWRPLRLHGIDEPVIVRAWLEDANGVNWLATEGHGLVYWDGRAAYAFRTGDGMVDDTLFSVVDDEIGSLWVSSSRGLGRIRKTEFDAVRAGTSQAINCVTFGRVDGFLSTATSGGNSPSAIRLADGRVMTATDKGVAVVDPAALQLNSKPPAVVIESVMMDDRPVPLSPNGGITISAGARRLEFRYTALSLIAPQRLRFRYQLQGSDPDWVDAGSTRTARYTHLEPGRYVFQVLACNNDGVWNDTGANIVLTLQPRFYQALWFQLAVACLAAFGLASAVSLRIRQMHQREEALARTNAELDQRVRERTTELATTYKQLVSASRKAGMAEVATGVLHNVGNVLNSVNVSASVLSDGLRQSRGANLGKITSLLQENASRLPEFLTEDPRGRQLVPYLETLSSHLTEERERFLGELESLRTNVDHIKEIVARQQAHAHHDGLLETLSLSDLVEEALRMNPISSAGQPIEIVREFGSVPAAVADRHKVLQIVINLLQNARQAVGSPAIQAKRIAIRVAAEHDAIALSVTDNGIGIPAENLDRIFEHGFTTKANGHGFGLHASANAAREMHGTLTVESSGLGRGARFILRLPVAKPGAKGPKAA